MTLQKSHAQSQAFSILEIQKFKAKPNDVIDTEDAEVLLLIKCSQIPILTQSACVAANIVIVNPQ